MTANKLPANNKGSDSIAITELETPRLLTFNIFRHNPADENSQVHRQKYLIEEAPSMTLFIALNEIRATQDPSLQFDFVCRAGICGSCAMLKAWLSLSNVNKRSARYHQLSPLARF